MEETIIENQPIPVETENQMEMNEISSQLPPPTVKTNPQDIDLQPVQNEVSFLRQKLRKTKDKKSEIDENGDDMLFLKSVLPYMASLPLVQKLKLRGEINAAIMRACGKKVEKEDLELLKDVPKGLE